MANAVGGQELSVFFPIDSDHTTVTAVAELTLDEDTVKTDIQKDAVQYDTVKFDPELVDFIQDNANIAAAEGSPEEVVTEKGRKISTATATAGAQFIDLIYGAVINYGGNDLQIVTVCLGTVSADSEAFSQEYQKFNRLPFKLDLVAAKADVALVAALFDSTLIDTATAGAQTLPKGRKKKIFMLPVAP